MRMLPSASRHRVHRLSTVIGSIVAVVAVTAITVPASASASAEAVSDPTSYVDPFIGTQLRPGGGTETPYGDTYPGATTPFGMVQFGPSTYNTNADGNVNANMGGYEYDADQIRGFSLDRISGTGCQGSYGEGDFPIYTYTGPVNADGSLTTSPAANIQDYYTDFTHTTEKASPGQYSITLGNGVGVQLTATTRTGDGVFTFPKSSSSSSSAANKPSPAATPTPGPTTTPSPTSTPSPAVPAPTSTPTPKATPTATPSPTSTPATAADATPAVAKTTTARSTARVAPSAQITPAPATPSPTSDTLVFDTAGSINGSNASSVAISGDTISGSTQSPTTCGASSYKAYFWATFSKTPVASGTWQGSAVTAGATTGSSAQANGTGAYVSFAPGSAVTVNVGVSYVSVADAEQNEKAEVGSSNWSNLANAAHKTWENALDQVQVSSSDTKELTTFYTALYHSMVDPNIIDDVNGDYPGYDGQVHKLDPGQKHEYANFSGWDTYRSEAQLIGLLFPNRSSDINDSLLHLGEQAGWYNWPMLSAAQNKLDGDSLDIIMSELDAFGGTHFDAKAAVQSMVAANELPATSSKRSNAFQDSALGFVSENAPGSDFTSQTIEYAEDDFAIAQLAQQVGDTADYKTFSQRSQAWQNLFDPGNNALTPRSKNGFDTSFDLGSGPGNEYQESSGDQYNYLVTQNVAGLIAKSGGDVKFEADLNQFLSQLNAGHSSPYAYLSNEVSDEAPWLYNWVGRPDLTANVNQEMRDQLWSDNSPTGIAGNDDLGTLSSYYVWSALGLYPAVYGRSELVVDGPIFSSIHITSDNGRQYSISAPGVSDSNRYVTSMRVNGVERSANWLPESFAQKGGTLQFTMSSKPGTWGTTSADAPPSFGQGANDYNNVAISLDGSASTGSFDASNNSYSPSALAADGLTPGAKVTLPNTSVSFTWPNVPSGTADNWIPSGQVISLGNTRLSQLSFIGAATNGPSTGFASVNYTDGTHQIVDVELTDWTPSSPSFGNIVVASTAHRNQQSGAPDTTQADVFATVPVALDSSKQVASVTLPTSSDQGIMHIFALGTAVATTTPLKVTSSPSVPPAAAGQMYGAVLSTFGGGNGATADAYHVTVNWGDRTRPDTDAAVTNDATAGQYDVYDQHTFSRPGDYHVAVTVSDGSHTATSTSTVVVK